MFIYIIFLKKHIILKKPYYNEWPKILALSKVVDNL